MKKYLSIPKLQRWSRWSLGMDTEFHPIFYWACDSLSTLELKLNHVCKRGLRHSASQHFCLHVMITSSNAWKHFPRCWPFVWGIHRFPVNSPHKGQRRGALMFSLICVWINGWVNNREAGDLRRYRAHYDVIVMVPENLNRASDHSRLDSHAANVWNYWEFARRN